MTEGALFSVSLGGGAVAGGKVLAAGDDVVRVAVAGIVWDCAPDAAWVDEAPRAVDHLALRPEALDGATWLGAAAVRPEERTPAFAAWDALPPGERPVVRAPFAAIAAALLG